MATVEVGSKISLDSYRPEKQDQLRVCRSLIRSHIIRVKIKIVTS